MHPDMIDGDLEEIAVGAHVSTQYLEHLKSVCPAPLHAGAYDHLVAEASARRDLRSAADDLAIRAKAVGYGPLADQSLLVAEAIHSHLVAFDPDTMTAALTRPRVTLDNSRETAEESVLAAVLTGHQETMPMLEILRPTAWSDPARGEMHAAMMTLAASGRDIDPLTVDWQISHARERNGEPAGHAVATSAGPSYATKVAGKPVTGNPVRQANSLMDAVHRAAQHETGGPTAMAKPSLSRDISPSPPQGQPPTLVEPPQEPSSNPAPGQMM